MQVVLLTRGICKGQSSKVLTAALGLNYISVLTLRHEVQAKAEQILPDTPLPNQRTETADQSTAR
jgi:hypothetical protein